MAFQKLNRIHDSQSLPHITEVLHAFGGERNKE